jgi:hypothetical protein
VAALSSGRLRGSARLRPDPEQDRARTVFGQAARGLAFNAIGAYATHALLDQTGPHASVDATCIRAPDDEGPEWASGRGQFRSVALDRDHGSLKAQRPEGITNLLEPGRDLSRRLQTGGGGERAAEVLARLAKCYEPAASGHLLDQEGDQFGEAPVGELDPFELRRDAIDLGRTPSPGPAPTATPFERDAKESRLNQPIEPAAGDVSVHAELGRRLSSGEGIAPAARVQEDPPKLRIASGCKAIERHGTKSYPHAEMRSVRGRERGREARGIA